jgi:hypothetical protein
MENDEPPSSRIFCGPCGHPGQEGDLFCGKCGMSFDRAGRVREIHGARVDDVLKAHAKVQRSAREQPHPRTQDALDIRILLSLRPLQL